MLARMATMHPGSGRNGVPEVVAGSFMEQVSR